MKAVPAGPMAPSPGSYCSGQGRGRERTKAPGRCGLPGAQTFRKPRALLLSTGLREGHLQAVAGGPVARPRCAATPPARLPVMSPESLRDNAKQTNKSQIKRKGKSRSHRTESQSQRSVCSQPCSHRFAQPCREPSLTHQASGPVPGPTSPRGQGEPELLKFYVEQFWRRGPWCLLSLFQGYVISALWSRPLPTHPQEVSRNQVHLAVAIFTGSLRKHKVWGQALQTSRAEEAGASM